MLTWIKLDGNNIVGHFHNPRLHFKEGSFSDNGYHAEIDVDHWLVNNEGNHKYKYVDGNLVELTEQEILAHPLYKEPEGE